MSKWVSPWIHTTDRCNCVCSYCFVRKQPKDMSAEIYGRINQYFLDNAHRYLYIKYRISGGEPLLVFDKWFDFVCEFLDKIGNKGGVEILSNFTIYPEKLDGLITHSGYCNLNVSLDSLTMSKPYSSGKSSASDVLHNIETFRSRHKRDMFIMTVLTDNGIHLPALAEYICSIGAKWEIQANKEYDPRLDWRLVNDAMKKVIGIFKKYKRPLNTLLYNFCDMQTDRHCENGGALFAIMPNGDLTNCQMQSPLIGTVWDDIINVLDTNQSMAKNRNEKCLQCIISEYCHGDCPLKSNDLRRLNYICNTMKYYVYHALKEELYAEPLYAT